MRRSSGSLTEINSSNLYETLTAALSTEWEGWSWVFAVISLAIFLVILVLALLIAALLPKPVRIISEAIRENTFKVILCGILGLVLIAPLALLLTVSVVGIALIPLEVIIVVCSVLLGFIAVGQLIGGKVLRLFKRPNRGMVRETFWGLIVLWLDRLDSLHRLDGQGHRHRPRSGRRPDHPLRDPPAGRACTGCPQRPGPRGRRPRPHCRHPRLHCYRHRSRRCPGKRPPPRYSGATRTGGVNYIHVDPQGKHRCLSKKRPPRTGGPFLNGISSESLRHLLHRVDEVLNRGRRLLQSRILFGVSLIWIISSIPPLPSFTGTPMNSPLIPYSPSSRRRRPGSSCGPSGSTPPSPPPRRRAHRRRSPSSGG